MEGLVACLWFGILICFALIVFMDYTNRKQKKQYEGKLDKFTDDAEAFRRLEGTISRLARDIPKLSGAKPMSALIWLASEYKSYKQEFEEAMKEIDSLYTTISDQTLKEANANNAPLIKYDQFFKDLEQVCQNINDVNTRMNIDYGYKLAGLRAVRKIREFVNTQRDKYITET